MGDPGHLAIDHTRKLQSTSSVYARVHDRQELDPLGVSLVQQQILTLDLDVVGYLLKIGSCTSWPSHLGPYVYIPSDLLHGIELCYLKKYPIQDRMTRLARLERQWTGFDLEITALALARRLIPGSLDIAISRQLRLSQALVSKQPL